MSAFRGKADARPLCHRAVSQHCNAVATSDRNY